MRQLGADAATRAWAPIYLAVNRNKRSIVPRPEAARPRARRCCRLAEGADVLVHNVRPQAMRAARARLRGSARRQPAASSMSAPTASGADGPYGDKPAYDDIIQGVVGHAPSLPGARHGDARATCRPSSPTSRPGSITVLSRCSAPSTTASAPARARRSRCRCSRRMAACRAWSSTCTGQTFDAAARRDRLQRASSTRTASPFRRRTATSAILPYTDQQWRDFFSLIGRQDLLGDARFKTLGTRLRHIESCTTSCARSPCTRTNAEWLDALDRPIFRRCA